MAQVTEALTQDTASQHEQIIDRCIKENGPCCYIDQPGLPLFVFKRPEQDDWEETQEAIGNKVKTKYAGFRELAQLCLVYPDDVGALQKLFRDAPAVPALLADELSDLAMGGIEIKVKKG